MKLLFIKADGFRNIEGCSLSFSPGVNLIYGKNAEGKTNLLEAIYYFARGKSFRGAKDKELTGFLRDGFSIEIEYEKKEKKESLLYRFFGGEKKREHNRIPLASTGEMLGKFSAVLFHPEHLSMVFGTPQLRRDFLNVAIAKNNPAYLLQYSQYLHLLENRNALLKLRRAGLLYDEREMKVFEERLALSAAEIAKERYDYIRLASPIAATVENELSGKREQLSVSYDCEVEEDMVPKMSEKYRILLEKSADADSRVGFTQVGPHRDDIGFLLNERPAREYASQGQGRSIALAMKLAEGEVTKNITGEYPVFLFDDVLSELDEGRRAYLLSSLAGRQILVTACDARDFSGCRLRLIYAEGGRYEVISE